MPSSVQTVSDYLDAQPSDRKEPLTNLRNILLQNLPDGFEECISYGMIGYVVPHHIFPAGYHCDPKLPLPFINLASQKNFIALYHMGVYADKPLNDWFVSEYPRHAKNKLDMGKSCIRFKKMDDIPYDLIAQLTQKISVNDWISLYQSTFIS